MASIGQLAGYAGRAAAILCVVMAVVPLAGDAQDRYPVDWQAVGAESMEYFLDLLRIEYQQPARQRKRSRKVSSTSAPTGGHRG